MNKFTKLNDSVYGTIEVDPFIANIIRLPEFTRLDDIKQVGCYCFINSDATHTRYQHSIGVYYLANCLIKHLQTSQPELNITDSEVKCVSLAGLLHDIGHGPFSHLFDEWVEITLGDDYHKIPESYHEYRSGMIIEYLNKHYNLELDSKEISMIRSMIDPIKIPKSRRFLYQIVANKDNNLDVDKIDYLKRDGKILKKQYNRYIDVSKLINGFRVCEDNLVVNKDNYINVLNIFTLRYMFHREFYNSTDSKTVDLIMKKIFTILNENNNYLINSLNKPEVFLTLTDSILVNQIIKNKETAKLYAIILSKTWWKSLAKIKVPSETNIKMLKEKLQSLEKEYKKTKIVVTKIGLVSGNKKNPLQCIDFYDTKEESELFRLNDFVLFREYYQETLVYIFRDESEKVRDASILNQVYKIIKECVDDFSLGDSSGRKRSDSDSLLII